MNLLKTYSKISQLSYRSVRTFASTGKGSFGTRKSTQETSTASTTGTSTSSTNTSTTTGKAPEQFTSTNTQFTSFSKQGPTSGFSSPGTDTGSTNDASQNYSSSAKQNFDSAASDLRNLADKAADTAKDFTDQVNNPNRYGNRSGIDFANQAQDLANTAASAADATLRGAANVAGAVLNSVTGGIGSQSSANRDSYSDRNRNDYNDRSNQSGTDFINQAASAAQGLANTAANVAGATLKGMAHTAGSMTSTFTGQPSSNRDSYGNQYDRSRTYRDTKTSDFRSTSSAVGNKPPEHFTSTNTQFTSFSNQGPTSGFNSSEGETGTSQSTHQASSSVQGAVNTAANMADATLRGFADAAGSVASGLTGGQGYRDNRDTRYDDRNRDPYYDRNRNNSGDPISSAVRGVADAVGNVASVAGSIASSFIPGAQGNRDYRDPRYDDRNRDPYYDRNRNSSSDSISSAVKGIADIAGSVASSFIPGAQGNRDNRYDDRNRDPNYDRNRNNFSDRNSNSGINMVNTTIQGVANAASTIASSFIPGTSARAGSDPLTNMASNIAGSVVNSTVKGIADAASNAASSFFPGGQSSNRADRYEDRNYDNRNRDYNRDRNYDNRAQNPGQDFVGAAVKGLSDVAQGLATAASRVTTTFIPSGIGANRISDHDRVHHIDRHDNHDRQHHHNRHDRHRNTVGGTHTSSGNDFMYTGSQVEDLTFTDANKQGTVDSDSLSETFANSVQNYAQTAREAARDVGKMAYTGSTDFGREATKAATDAVNNFATAAGQAALSSAASVARNFNKIASATDEMHDNNQGFIYTGTQVTENLAFTQSENKDLNKSFKGRRTHNHRLYDVVISGGGVNGGALACALAHYRYFGRDEQKILLLDPKEPPSLDEFHSKDKVADQRVVSLSLSSTNFLKELGVWSLLNRDRIGSVHQMQVWEAGGNSFIKFNDNPEREIGYVVESSHLQAAIFERLRALGNIQLEIPNKITDIRNDTDNFATVVLNDEERVSARLVVGSDGANSLVKNKARISSTGWNTNQQGIVCTVKTHFHNTTAWQRFLTTGPIAILPLWDEYSSIVWSCESDFHHTLMQYHDRDFLKELNYNLTRKPLFETPNLVFNRNSAFDLPPTITEICNKRRSFPLSMQQANNYVAQRIALIGDAAHTIHPLAGQGLNLGLMDAAYLANTIIRNLRTGNDIGSRDLLREYEAASMNLNTTMMYSLEFIKRSYETNEYNPVVQARNLTTSLVNNLTPLKTLFVDVANGKYFQPTDYEWKKVG